MKRKNGATRRGSEARKIGQSRRGSEARKIGQSRRGSKESALSGRQSAAGPQELQELEELEELGGELCRAAEMGAIAFFDADGDNATTASFLEFMSGARASPQFSFLEIWCHDAGGEGANPGLLCFLQFADDCKLMRPGVLFVCVVGGPTAPRWSRS